MKTDVRNFMIRICRIFLGMKNISHETGKDDRNTFMFNAFYLRKSCVL
jgi:hypothetical protein